MSPVHPATTAEDLKRAALATIHPPPSADPEPVAPESLGGHLRAENIIRGLLRPGDVDLLEDPGWLIDRYILSSGMRMSLS